MSKACRVLSIIVCAVCITGVVAVGIYYFCFSIRAKSKLSVEIKNLSLTVGQSCEIDCKVSKRDAVVTFSVTDSEVVALSESRVTGLKAGSTFLRANAECGGDSAYSIAKITVIESSGGQDEQYDYVIEVVTMDNEVVGDHVDYTQPLYIQITLLRNDLPLTADFALTATDGIGVTLDLGYYLIVASKSGSITIRDTISGASREIFIEVK